MPPHEQGTRSFAGTLKHPALVIVLLLLAPAMWVLLVATTNPHELFVGACTSVATIVFTVFVCRSSSVNLKLRFVDTVQCWRIPWYILSGAWEIGLILFKDLLHNVAGTTPAQNLYRVCGFDTSAHDPLRMARTVMAVAYTTTAPNFIVVGVDPSQSRMLFHQIASSSVPLMTKALGAKA